LENTHGEIYHASGAPSIASRPAVSQRFLDNLYGRIARRYDAVNTLQSLGLDGRARRAVAACAARGRVLDVGAGTAKLAAALLAAGAASVVCVDRSWPMFEVARRRFAQDAGLGRIRFVIGDATRLPFRAAAFDGVAAAFLFRNLPDIDAALAEAARVVRPGAPFATVDTFAPPGGLWGLLYRGYLRAIVPAWGYLVARDVGAYRYLVASIGRCFTGGSFAARLAEAGFRAVRAAPLLAGVMNLITGYRR